MPRLTLEFKSLTPPEETFGWTGGRFAMKGLIPSLDGPLEFVDALPLETSDEDRRGDIDLGMKAVLGFFVEARLMRGTQSRFASKRPYVKRLVHLKETSRTPAKILGYLRSEIDPNLRVGVCGQIIDGTGRVATLITKHLKISEIAVLIDDEANDISKIEALFRWLTGEEPPSRATESEPRDRISTLRSEESMEVNTTGAGRLATGLATTVDRMLQLPGGKLLAIGFAVDGCPLAALHDEGVLSVSRMERDTRARPRILRVSPECAAISPNGRLLFVGCRDCVLRVLDLEEGTEFRNESLRSWASSAVFSSDSNSLVVIAGNEIYIRAFNGQPPILQRRCPKVTCAAISAASRHLFAGTASKTVWHWDLASEDRPVCSATHSGAVTSIDCCPDGTRGISAGNDGTLLLWGFPSNSLEQKKTNSISCVRLSSDCQYAISGDRDGHASLWRLSSGTKLCDWVHHGEVVAAAFSRTQPQLLMTSDLRTARIRSI